MRTSLIVLMIFLRLLSNCDASDDSSCSDKDYLQIKTNFSKSYKRTKFFWDTLYCYQNLAMSGDLNAISSIIDLSEVGQQNSEYTEWLSELIEKLFLKSSSKLFDALITKDKEKVEYVMHRLKYPLDGETDAITSAAKKIQNNPKYKKLAAELIITK